MNFSKNVILPSLQNCITIEENISLTSLKKELRFKSFVLNHYVINYNGKIIGINITINDEEIRDIYHVIQVIYQMIIVN